MISFTFHYVSISTLFGAITYLFHSLFTFHYVSISTYIHPVALYFRNIYIPLCIYFNADESQLITFCHSSFTFHYVSISTILSMFDTASDVHLHSTMYLFQLDYDLTRVETTLIYIPLCIYFNLDLQKPYIY